MNDEEMRVLIWLMRGGNPEDRPSRARSPGPQTEPRPEARWVRWWSVWRSRWERFACRRLGLHTYGETHDLDMDRGTITYGGWRCIVCDEPMPLG
jgi:hypothetical protein